jgi:alkylation response protein AidB-like acyl-CoA dehydrogenase
MAAMIGLQRGLEVHVMDHNADGPKPRLAKALGAEYHTRFPAFEPDIVVECTGSPGVIVQAVTGSKGEGRPELSCFIVEAGTKGFTAKAMHGKLMWRSSDTSELYFEDVFVPDSQLLGKQGDGSKQMLSTLDRGKIGIAAMGVGCAQGAYEKALAYANERRQFGKAISGFQSIAFALADMHMKIEMARTYLYKTCWMADRGDSFTKEAAIAKLYSSEVAGFVTDMAVQIHGGYGLMEEYDVERFWRDHRLLRIGEGTSEIQRLIISRQIGCAE